MYLGPEYKGPHGEALVPMTYRERFIAIPLVVFALLFGVYPNAVFRYMAPSVNQTVQDLAEYTERENLSPRPEQQTQTARQGLALPTDAALVGPVDTPELPLREESASQ